MGLLPIEKVVHKQLVWELVEGRMELWNHNRFELWRKPCQNSTVYVMGVYMSPKTCTLWKNVMICAQPFWSKFFWFLCL